MNARFHAFKYTKTSQLYQQYGLDEPMAKASNRSVETPESRPPELDDFDRFSAEAIPDGAGDDLFGRITNLLETARDVHIIQVKSDSNGAVKIPIHFADHAEPVQSEVASTSETVIGSSPFPAKHHFNWYNVAALAAVGGILSAGFVRVAIDYWHNRYR